MDTRDILIDFSQPFYADRETCEHNVDEYLKTIEKELQEQSQETAENQYEKSLRLINKFLDKISKEEIAKIIKRIDALNFEGPTVEEYFSSMGFQFKPAKEITDEEIEKWAENYENNRIGILGQHIVSMQHKSGLVEGAKAMRDNEIG